MGNWLFLFLAAGGLLDVLLVFLLGAAGFLDWLADFFPEAVLEVVCGFLFDVELVVNWLDVVGKQNAVLDVLVNKPDIALGVVAKPDTALGVVSKPDIALGVIARPDIAPRVPLDILDIALLALVYKQDTTLGVVSKPDIEPEAVDKPDIALGVVGNLVNAPEVVGKSEVTALYVRVEVLPGIPSSRVVVGMAMGVITPLSVNFSCVLGVEGAPWNEGVDEFRGKFSGPPKLLGASMGMGKPALFSSTGSCGITESRPMGISDPMPHLIILSWAEKEDGRVKESGLRVPVFDENEEDE